MAKEKPISEALQRGERLKLANGTYIEFERAATLKDLEECMDLYNEFISVPSIQACYIKGNEKAKDAFEELLYIATGRKIEKEELRGLITVDDTKAIYEYLHRFLGFVVRDTGTEKEAEKQ